MEIRKDIVTRFGIIYFLIVLVGLVIIGGILRIQNVKTDQWKEIAKDIKENTAEIPAHRGNICADDGSVLATSVPYYEIRLDLAAPRIKEVFGKQSGMLVAEMSQFFGISQSTFNNRLNNDFNKGNRWFLVDEKRLNHVELKHFKQLSSMKKSMFGSGLIILPENLRVLPHKDLASRTIGVLNKGGLGGIHGNVGYTGIEEMQESFLAGVSGKALKTNYSGRWIDMPITEPIDGRDVITTINVNLQDYAQNALMRQMETSQAVWGTAVVMEVETGDIKAIANVGIKKDGTYSETYNYALGHHGCSEPGSTFKLMSLMVALEDGYADTCDIVDTGNGVWELYSQKIHDSDYKHGGHGRISMKRVFELSSNVGTAKIIMQHYAGKEREFIDRIYKFGLNKPLDLGIAGEGIPFIKYPGDASWWGPSLAWISHGYEIKITPLQTLTFYNAVANNGKMVKPRFVKEIRENGILIKKTKTEVINPSICSKETLGKAQSMLHGVVEKGTGKSLKNKLYTLAGKTGTAVIAQDNQGYTKGGKKEYQASFAGYFPFENPKYSCIVVIVGPQGLYYGASVAGPVFKEIADKVYATFLDPKEEQPKDTISMPLIKSGYLADIELTSKEIGLDIEKSGFPSEIVKVQTELNKMKMDKLEIVEKSVPDLTGMGASDALSLLENAGMKVRLNGFGKVQRQSVSAGMPIMSGETISLELAMAPIDPNTTDSIQVAKALNGETTTSPIANSTQVIKQTPIPKTIQTTKPATKPVAKQTIKSGAKTVGKKTSKAKSKSTNKAKPKVNTNKTLAKAK